ncbi:cartilage matrix protein-like [Argopecten irradians]|uniref:cartilage matrix protein-like n=1 Tax=Argopecten irradians TaxID=31199 RepID=UPI00371199F9
MGWLLSVVITVLAVKASAGADVVKMNCKADIAFVVDSSSSVWKPDFDIQIEFIEDLVKRFDVGPENVQFAALSYSSTVEPEFNFNTSSTEAGVLSHVSDIKYTAGGATLTYRAIKQMQGLFTASKGSRDDVVHVGIILTDGTTNPGHIDNFNLTYAAELTQMNAQSARDQGIYLFAVGIGTKTNDTELNGIASDPDSNYMIRVVNYKELNTERVREELALKACNPIPRPGPIVNPSSTPSTPQGEDPKEVCQGKPADVFFLLDESSSIHNVSNFRLELSFVEQVIDYLDVGTDVTRVGVMTFSSTPKIQFYLDSFTTKDKVQEAVSEISWGGGNTYTNLALDELITEGFTVGNGARQGVAQIAVILTDGNSTNPTLTLPAAQAVQNRGIYVFAIGVGGVYRPELEMLASDPSSEFVFTVDNLGALNTIKELLAYRVCKENFETLKEICSQQVADIAIIMDTSSFVGQDDYDDLVHFIGQIVNNLDVSPASTRVSVMTFADTANVAFGLDSYTSSAEVTQALSGITRATGTRKISEAIKKLPTIFTGGSSERGVPKIGVMFISGNSRDPKETREMSNAARARGIHMLAVGIGQYVAEDQLKDIASDSESYIMVSDFANLDSVLRLLTTKICQAEKKSDCKLRSEKLEEESKISKKRLKEIQNLIDVLKRNYHTD